MSTECKNSAAKTFLAGLKSCRPAKKPFINTSQRLRRLKWCQEFKDWTMEQWRHVVFSDESMFSVFGSKGSVRRRSGERFKPECMEPTVKHPETIMIWSCISHLGVGRLYLLEKGDKFNAARYQHVLETRLIPSAREWFPNGDWFFQDDGAPCHHAKSVKCFLQERNITPLPWWPGQSPDLNPIENLWYRVQRLVEETNPASRNDLISAVIRVWNHIITQEELKKLIDSMPKRIKAVIDAKGHPSKYWKRFYSNKFGLNFYNRLFYSFSIKLVKIYHCP